MIIIGEKINGSIPSVAKAIQEKDEQLIKDLAISQTKAGATYIDVCASVEDEIEVETMKWLIDLVQSVTDTPIAVDSPNARTCVECMKFCNKPGLINSVSGEGDKMEVVFPVIADTPWEVVALLNGDAGIPKTAADRIKVFDDIIAKAESYGISPSRIHIDPLVEMLCTAEDGISMVEEVMSNIKGRYPDIHITGAVSNISFNLPTRKLVNQAFVVLSIYSGMDSAVLNPLDKAIMGMIRAAEGVINAGAIVEDADLTDIIAGLPEQDRKCVYPAYVTLCMKKGILMPEYDEDDEEYDMEGFIDEVKGGLDEAFGLGSFTGILYAANAMLGNDEMCMAYIMAYRDDMYEN